MRRILAVILLSVAVTAGAQILDAPVAVVRLTETVNIGLRELNAQIALFTQQAGRELTPAEKQQLLDALVNDQLLRQAASRASVQVSQQEIQSYLEMQRQQWSQLLGVDLTQEQFRGQVERETGDSYATYVEDLTNEILKLKYVQQEKADLFADIAAPTESQIESFYEEQATSFTNPAMISFRHIYVDLRGKSDAERQEARELLDGHYRSIRNGEMTFDQVTRLALDDPRFSAADFGYLLRNDMANIQLLGTNFINEVFALDVGDIAGVLESNVAIHIVRITDKRPPRILELDDPVLPGQNVTVRQQIRDALASQFEQEALVDAVEQVVAELREEAEITVFESNLPW
jgi:peptidyl-prolyl cis-trans isomerase SurA